VVAPGGATWCMSAKAPPVDSVVALIMSKLLRNQKASPCSLDRLWGWSLVSKLVPFRIDDG
jgi:hypothetical protein